MADKKKHQRIRYSYCVTRTWNVNIDRYVDANFDGEVQGKLLAVESTACQTAVDDQSVEFGTFKIDVEYLGCKER